MAEESIDLVVTPEITKPNERNSRRNSMGKASSSDSGEKVLPRYLRASTGSCHDFCKYGRKHAFETKERRPIRKRITKPAAEDQSPTITVMLPERKKTSVVKSKPSPTSKTSSSDVPEIIKREVSTKSVYGGNLNASVDGHNSVRNEVQSGVKKMVANKLRSSPISKVRLSESPEFKRQEVSSISRKVDVSSKKASLESKETNTSAKHATSLKLKSPADKPLSSTDHSGGLSCRRNTGIHPGNKRGPPKVAVKKALASPRLSLSSPRLSLSPKPSITRVASLNSRKHKSLKVVSPLKSQATIKKTGTDQSKDELKQASNGLVHEKTLYVIKMEIENKSLESTQNENCAIESSPPPPSSIPEALPTSLSPSLHNVEDEVQSEYTETEAEDDSLSECEYEYEYEYDESMGMEGEENLGGEDQGRPKKDRMVRSEDKESQAVKLRFRRGKVVDIQSENNGPRRLKFRRGRVLGESRNLKADCMRSFKKKIDGEVNDSQPNSEKVVLRHQDVQGKKDSQLLFNNVIEQTASKLVESRKSKVKALVGAFETVISLQETKPSANVVT